MINTECLVKYTCDLESELNLDWGEGTLAFCKENGGKWWKIESNVWVEKANGNPPTGGYDGNPATITQDSTHRFATDAEKTTWNAKQAALGFTPANVVHNHDGVYATAAHTHAGVYEPVTSNANKGYTINVQALTSSPADGQTIYFGTLPKVPVTVQGTSKIYIRAAGTIKRAEIYCFSGTAGSNEAWPVSIRLNNSGDTLIQSLSVSASERVFTNASLNIAVVAGDYFEVKVVNPTFATNPLTTVWGGYVYIE